MHYFEQFGGVEFVCNRGIYGVVQFETVEAANCVLSHGPHEIAYWTVEVTAAHLWDQPEHYLDSVFTAPEQESPSHILNALNDDVLRQIFLYMDTKTLTNAAEVCIRFNNHAKEAFAKKHTKLRIYDRFLQIPNGFEPAEIKSFLKNFGETIRFLDVRGDLLSSPNNHLRAVSEKCIEQHFKNLVRAKIEKVSTDVIVSFIKLNPTLEELIIIDGDELPKIVQAVVDNLSHLTLLTIDKIRHDYYEFLWPNCCVSTQLTLNCRSVYILSFVEMLATNNIPIEELNIIDCKINTVVVDSISKFVRIKVLKFIDIDGQFTDDDLIQLAKGLPKLQELHLLQEVNENTSFELTKMGLKEMLKHVNKLSYLVIRNFGPIFIDVDDYEAMLQTVQNRKDKVKLTIFCNYFMYDNVPDDIISKNRSILQFNL